MAQTYANYEIILVDDGSEDDIKYLLEEQYLGKVKLITQKNQGVSAARNSGIKNSTGEYIAFLDADDCWSPFYLQKNADVIKENADVKIIGSHYSRNINHVDKVETKLKYKELEDYFKKQAINNTLFTSSSSVISLAFFKNNDGFNKHLKRGEDIDVWLRVMASPGKAYYIENTLVYYSDEDAAQATKVLEDLQNTLSGNIIMLYQSLFLKYNNVNFEKFASKYIYFTIYPYYFSNKDHHLAKEVLKQKKYSYFFLDLAYHLPFFIGKKIIESKRGSKYFRLYLKFFLRKIYS